MLEFELLIKNNFSKLSKDMFAILADNMSNIAPTGNTYDGDYKIWHEAVGEGLKKEERNIVLIYISNILAGFFQYYTDNELFMMEEIQIAPDYQGKKYNIFRSLFGYIFSVLPPEIDTVEAYANKKNIKSQEILRHLGLHVIGENKSGSSYHYQGYFENLIEWHCHGK